MRRMGYRCGKKRNLKMLTKESKRKRRMNGKKKTAEKVTEVEGE